VRSQAWRPSSGWAGLYLHSDAGVDLRQYEALSFFIHGSRSGQKVKIRLYDANNKSFGTSVTIEPVLDAWKQFTIPLAALGGDRLTKGIVFQEGTGQSQSYLHFDSIRLLAPSAAPKAPTGVAAAGACGSITIDWNDNLESDLAYYAVRRSTQPDTAAGVWTRLPQDFKSSFATDSSAELVAGTQYPLLRHRDRHLRERQRSLGGRVGRVEV
jgi:hypothetical protein